MPGVPDDPGPSVSAATDEQPAGETSPASRAATRPGTAEWSSRFRLLAEIVCSAAEPAYRAAGAAAAARAPDSGDRIDGARIDGAPGTVDAPSTPGRSAESGAPDGRDAAGAAGATSALRERRGHAVSAAVALAGLVMGLIVIAGRDVFPDVGTAHSIMAATAERRAATNRALATQAADLRARVTAAAAAATALGRTRASVAADLARLEPAAGDRAVRGPGVRVVLTDPPSSSTPTTGPRVTPTATATTGDRVIDRDIAEIVNVLWAGGAEAIDVGGTRITSTSAIRAAGDAILVDFRALSSPYVIDAVGPGANLTDTVKTSAVWNRLVAEEAHGLALSMTVRAAITVPAATVTVPHLAREIPR